MAQRMGGRARARGRHDGFTLIELLVVIAILGILAGVVVFSVRGVDDRGESAANAIDRRTIATAQEAYRAQHGSYGTEAQLVAGRFLQDESTLHEVDLVYQDGDPAGAYQITEGQAVPDADQNLTVAWSTGDPWATNKLRLSRYDLNTGTCETLAKLQNDYKVVPWLATGWEIINPGNHATYTGNPTFRFHLRPGVTFHNGTPLTADAVKYSFDRLVDKGEDFTAKFNAKGQPSSMVVVDADTIDVTPATANFRLVDILVHPTFSILAPGSEPSVNNDVVCTGPFKFTSYTSSEIVVTRNDAYWGTKAKARKITFKFVGDSTQRRQSLEAGTVDAIFDVGRQQVAGLRANSGLKVVGAPTSAVFLFYMNLNGTGEYTKLQSESVRRALALSIDREEFIEQNYEPGIASLVQTPSPAGILGSFAPTITGYQYDLAQARQLLQDDGWVEPSPGAVREKNGAPLNLRLLSTSADDSELLLDLSNRARQSGINIVIDVLTSKSSQKNQGLWDLDTSTPNQNDGNPAFLLTLQWWSQSVNPWLSCLAGTTPCGPWQQAGPEFDALVAQALSSPNYADTQKYAAQAMDLLVDEDAKTIPVAGISRVYGLQRNVAGFDPHPARLHVSWAGAYLTNAP